jgi:multicomponent Na+:H+ antiporter subunit G
MSGFLAWLSSALLLLGASIGLIGAIGVLRLPDSYTRLHAASKAGALGAALILAGVAAASEGGFALAEAEALTEADPGAAPPEHGAPAGMRERRQS